MKSLFNKGHFIVSSKVRYYSEDHPHLPYLVIKKLDWTADLLFRESASYYAATYADLRDHYGYHISVEAKYEDFKIASWAFNKETFTLANFEKYIVQRCYESASLDEELPQAIITISLA
uniref:Uncharacterized protein n=1 Tax=Pseudocercospora mori TaxID=1341201 RepID=A0A2L1K2P3_9PEZI|nr:hypothetical protein [Pseudocercospora mori]AVE15074.1 hypothetical protein [Pseudocercospora mori]